MRTMEIFGVGDRTFESRSSFHSYLSENHDDIVQGNLYICAGITEHNEEEFIDVIESEGWERTESFGHIDSIETEYGDGAAKAYLSFDHARGLFFLYTDQRKSEEIDKALLKLLKNGNGLHYLYIGPRIIRDLCDGVRNEWESSKVTTFIAKRTPGTEIGARKRPDTNRTINYYGDDGMEALDEVEREYGVLPHTVELHIPTELRFRVNKEGVFTLKQGSMSVLFGYMNSCISQTFAMKEEYDETDFKVLKVGNGYDVPESKPATIELSHSLSTQELKEARETINNSDYTMLDVYLDESSRTLSAKVFDSDENLFFNLRISSTKLRVFPREESEMEVFLRFFEFVQTEIDDKAEPQQNAEPALLEGA